MSEKETKPKKKAAASTKKAAEKKPGVKKTAAKSKKAPNYARAKKKSMAKNAREPKKLSERNSLTKGTPLLTFLARLDTLWLFIAGILLLFSILSLNAIFRPNDRASSQWLIRFAGNAFGSVSIVFYFGLAIAMIRCLMSMSEKFKKVPFRVMLYFLGLFVFAQLLISQNALRQIPNKPANEAAGYPAYYVTDFIINIIGNGGFIILMIVCLLFLFLEFWKYCMAHSTEETEETVPIHEYWKEVYTADDAKKAEEMEQMSLKTDIAEDFRASEKKHSGSKERTNLAEQSGRIRAGFGKIKDALSEMSRPVEEAPDKEAILEQESRRRSRSGDAAADFDEDDIADFDFTAEAEGNPEQDASAVIDSISDKKYEAPVTERPAPVRIEPAGEAATREDEPAETETVHIRAHSVAIDDEEETVTTSVRDVSIAAPVSARPKAPAPRKNPIPLHWALPDVNDMLDPLKPRKGVSPDDPAIKSQAEKIERLLDTFGAPSQVVDIQCGPTFSQFGVEPGFIERGGRKTRVRVKQIETLQKDLEMELSVKQLGIEAPIPGKTYIGIQVMNKTRIPVTLREVLQSDEFFRQKRELAIALGKDINGAIFGADLTRMPHLLIAGATGSGKSVCLNAILSCLLLHNTPDQLKLILIDPKRVELTGYNGIPHLITPVVADVEQVGSVLQWVLREMDMRNLHFMENGVRNIQDYNNKFPEKALPYIVVVIDELANLMMEAASDVESSIIRLAQTARAMGIHLIVATQRPSRDVITGTIKGNLPTRIAFAVSSYVDSQVILDRPGAENLFGKGDMFFMSIEDTNLRRLQCVYVSDDEIHRIVDYWKNAQRTDSQGLLSVSAPQQSAVKPKTERVMRDAVSSGGTLVQLPLFNEPTPPLKNSGDILYDEAVKLVQRNARASANMLVSKMSIGFSRANKLLARMEEEGIIGPPNANPAIPREVLDFGEFGPSNDALE